MIEYGCNIQLQHSQIDAFFEKTMCPDIAELQRRDAFFAKIDEELTNIVEGTDLVENIPDIDVYALMNRSIVYSSIQNPVCTVSLGPFATHSRTTKHSKYNIATTFNVVAA